MITIQVAPNSGLGNLLFQYAFGRHMALRNQTDVLLDFSYCFNRSEIFQVKSARHLAYFHLQARINNPDFLSRFFMVSNKKFLGWTKRMTGIGNKGDFSPNSLEIPDDYVISGFHYVFSPQLLEIADGSVITGYFQSEKFFKGVENIIREDLKIRLPEPSVGYTQVLKQITESNSVAIHVRRTDSLTNTKLTVCGSAYFHSAISRMKEMVKDPLFFYFSDDLDWVKENLPSENAVYVNLPESAAIPAIDISLMAACKHQIIPNSTFSWWGGWLNTNPEKVVISPDVWRTNQFENELAMRDLIPADWILIPLGE